MLYLLNKRIFQENAVNNRETPEIPQELPEPLFPQEVPYLPDSYEPDFPGSPEPEPSQQPEPNDD